MGTSHSSNERPRSLSHPSSSSTHSELNTSSTSPLQQQPFGGYPISAGPRQRIHSVPRPGQPFEWQGPAHPGFLRIVQSGAIGRRLHDSDSSSEEEGALTFNMASLARSLPPVHLMAMSDIKCPVCSKMLPPDDFEVHLVMCFTKPRISYNEDVLADMKGECVICLEEMNAGDVIARLPCLCIYHKRCIDDWFERSRSCPEHPVD